MIFIGFIEEIYFFGEQHDSINCLIASYSNMNGNSSRKKSMNIFRGLIATVIDLSSNFRYATILR